MGRSRSLLWFPLVLGSLVAGEPPAQPLLWRATKAEANSPTIHLLGSLHVGRPDFYPVQPQVAAAYADADLCVFEVNLAKAASLWQAGRLMLRGRLEDGKLLQDVVSEQTWTDLQACATRLGVPMLVLNPLKPWLCSQILTAAAVVQAGYDPQTGTDQHFFRLAQQDQKQIAALESVGQQLNILQQALEPLGEKVLVQTLEELADLKESLGKLAASWHAGDEKELAKLLREMEVDDEKAYALLISDRNTKWVPKLEKLAVSPRPVPPPPAEGEPEPPPVPTGPRHLFVVVGAGHLVGEDSILELLRQNGWTVERE